MSAALVKAGEFSFKYRGYLLPVAVLLYLIPSPRFMEDDALPGIVGFLIAAFGQVCRIATIGLAYIIRGGKDHRVYAEQLVTTGLYSHCRNPMYVGNFFLVIGLAIASNSWVFAIAGTIISLAMHRAIVAAEENFLRNKFGPEYDDYCARVPRWVPHLKGLGRTMNAMEFDWQRVLVKEYAASFDWFSATALVIIVNLWRDRSLDDHWLITAVMFLVIAARVVLSQRSRRLLRAEHIETAA
ncbi:MAG: methyltransferase family protein [Povalibacter sp.]